MYRQHYGKKIGTNVEARGFRPPSVLSIFAVGLEHFMHDKVFTSRSGLFRTVKESGINNPQSLLFGKVDLLFNVGFVVSLAALIFTFNSISGEKETGTLRMTIANSIPRSQILLAKVVGNYVALLIPFVISLLIALIILDASSDVSILSSQVYPSLLVIVLVTFLFILVMVILGICISTLTHTSITSIVMLLFVWVIFALALPKASPMIAEIIYPTESRSIISLRKEIVREEIQGELDEERRELFVQCLRAHGVPLPTKDTFKPPSFLTDGVEKEAYTKYDREAAALNEEYEKRIANEIRKIEQDYRNKRNVQASIAMNLSRISPVSCYTYLVSELSGTGVKEPDNFMENAQRYQDEVKRAIYDNILVKIYGGPKKGETVSEFKMSGETVEGFDPKQASIPDMRYQYTTLTEALEASWTDILLLFLFSILFFTGAFLLLRKYDVR